MVFFLIRNLAGGIYKAGDTHSPRPSDMTHGGERGNPDTRNKQKQNQNKHQVHQNKRIETWTTKTHTNTMSHIRWSG
jgi:hypothetical protein